MSSSGSVKLLIDTQVWIPASATQVLYQTPAEFADENRAFLPMTVIGYEGNDNEIGVYKLDWDSNLIIKTSSDDAQQREWPADEDLSISQPLEKLSVINQASVLHALRCRFKRDTFTATVGPCFLWLNPILKNGRLSNDSSSMQSCFEAGKSGRRYTDATNIYSFAEKTRTLFLEGKSSHAMIFRGCSGSGKTEAAKAALQYLLYVDASQFGRREALPRSSTLMQNFEPLGSHRNPLLVSSEYRFGKSVVAGLALFDAFASAPSERNATSSRCIRRFRLLYAANNSISNIEMSAHLIDTARLNFKNSSMRPLQIFAMLMAGLSPDLLASFHISDSQKLQYLNGSRALPEDMAAEMQFLRSSLIAVGLEEEAWNDAVRCLLSIVHLQSISIVGSSSAIISANSKTVILYAEQVLGIEAGSLTNIILKKIEPGKPAPVDNSPNEAKSIVEGISATIFFRAFSFLSVVCFGKSFLAEATVTGPSPPPPALSAGEKMMDIFDFPGAEVFEQGACGLGQMCFHYAEEKAHVFFLQMTLAREIGKYLAEGVKLANVSVPDCLSFVDFFDRPPSGIFGMLEDICQSAKPEDKAFFDKMTGVHAKTKTVKMGGLKGRSTSFTVRHFFGEVVYDYEGFVLTNKVRISPAAIAMLSTSNISRLVAEGPTPASLAAAAESSAPTPASLRNKGGAAEKAAAIKNYICTRACVSINKLFVSFENSSVSYALCVRTNTDAKANVFDPNFVAGQVLSLVLPNLVQLNKSGYSCCFSFLEFYTRFRIVMPFGYTLLPREPKEVTAE